MKEVDGCLKYALDQRAQEREIEEGLGNERLNQMMIFLQSRFNRIEEKFDKMDEKFDKMDERIDKLEKYQRSSSARFENKFRGKGGNSGQNAYLPIVNYENKLPSEENLDPLLSIDQIHSFSRETINKYLGFYGLSTDGILPIKRVRLETYLGVNFEFKKQEGESI